MKVSSFSSLFVLSSVCLSLVSVVFGQTCGIDGIDMSSATSSTDITGSDAVFNYYFNPCGVVHNPACAAKPGSMVCQSVLPGKGSGLYALAYFSTQPYGVWSALSGGGVQAVYTNGDGNCYNPSTGQDEPRTLTIQFPCQPTADANLKLVTDSSDGCKYTLTWGTPIACGGGGGGGGGGGSGSSSGLSGGWIFVIILLSGFVLYVIVGCIYKSKQLGATGFERCPQADFWKDAPGLVKDGALFTWRKIRGLCGGGAQSASSYDSL